jgi:serine/threonine protein kinase/tetratricopeptide (TPR) repeat protein
MTTEPQKLGKYKIVGKIGKGAMGEVYKGQDPVLNRFVAIKVIAETMGSDAELVERFKREARNAAQLNHPNIITIYDFVEEEGRLYMVMELLEGQDLKELIRSGNALTMDQILSIMEQIADGLGFAHSRGIIHRDLKPANIHVSKNGQVKILDFGLVHEASSDMTKTGQVMGTPNYMSPEQVQGLRVDPRSDIFSLGAVFYEFLTRKKPFAADSIHATMFKVVQGDREPLSQYTHLPKPLISMVDRALDKEPERRFTDATALRDHLRALRREILKGRDAESTYIGGNEMTIASGSSEAGTLVSTPPPQEKSGAGRSGPRISASASRGTLRERDVARSLAPPAAPSRSVGKYAVAVALLLAAGIGAYFVTRGSGKSEDVEALSQALLRSQLELMERSLSQKDYDAALSQAEQILQSDPSNADALRVQGEARIALQRIEEAVAAARSALDRQAMSEAADALAAVLALDPSHPLGVELSGQLNQHFQSQADTARTEMESVRASALSAGASERPEFAQGDRVRQMAADEFNRGVFTNAAQRYLEARDLYQQSRGRHQQAVAQRRAESEREQEAAGQQAKAARAALEARLKTAENAWSRLRQQPAGADLAQQPSYQRAMTEAGVAERLKGTGDLEGAAGAFEAAASYLERARRELTDAQSRRAREAEEARRTAAASTSAPSTAPPTTSAPSREQEESAIRQVLASYERAIESKDLALFRQVKPNLSASEEKVLTDAFRTADSQQVELTVQSIAIEGDSATVNVSRRDIITVRGRSQDGKSRPQKFAMSKTAGKWVIVQIGQ